MTSGKIVVVHGPADPALDSVLERGGLRRVMRMDDMAVWVFDGPGPCHSPAAVAGPPAVPGGPERLLLSVVQAAGVLGVGRTTAYQLIRAGELEVVHVGRSVRVPADALPDLVCRLRVGRRAGVVDSGGSAELGGSGGFGGSAELGGRGRSGGSGELGGRGRSGGGSRVVTADRYDSVCRPRRRIAAAGCPNGVTGPGYEAGRSVEVGT